MNKLKLYLNLIWIFSILGLQMIGNFSALMPLLEEALVTKKNWVKKEDILDSITWGRCGPGAAVINSIAYLGNKIKGPGAGAIATISFCIFPTCIILIIVTFLDNFMGNTYIISIMKGVSVAVVVRLLKSNIELWKKIMINKLAITAFFICIILIFVTSIPTIIYIVSGVILGVIIDIINTKLMK